MSRKLRIAMIAACPFPARRGTPARIIRMAEALTRRGHDVQVITYHLQAADEVPTFPVHRIVDIKGYSDTAPGPTAGKLLLLDPLLAMKIWQTLRHWQPDVIHAHHFEGLLAAMPAHRLRNIPLIFDAHVLLEGELEYYDIKIPQGLRQKISRYLDGRLPRMASHTVAVSEEIRDRLIDVHGLAPAAIDVVGNGVEGFFFDGCRDALPADGLQRLIFTGNLAAYQGTDYLLDALKHISEMRGDVRLLVVSDSEPAEFLAMARAKGVAHLVELRSSSLAELPSLITSARLALNPRTKCPGVPMKLLNYMATGTPIVSFAGSGKYLEHNKTGMLVADGDTRLFAQAALQLLDDSAEAQRIGRAAKDYALKNFTWESNAMALEGIYTTLLATTAQRSPLAAGTSLPLKLQP